MSFWRVLLHDSIFLELKPSRWERKKKKMLGSAKLHIGPVTLVGSRNETTIDDLLHLIGLAGRFSQMFATWRLFSGHPSKPEKPGKSLAHQRQVEFKITTTCPKSGGIKFLSATSHSNKPFGPYWPILNLSRTNTVSAWVQTTSNAFDFLWGGHPKFLGMSSRIYGTISMSFLGTTITMLFLMYNHDYFYCIVGQVPSHVVVSIAGKPWGRTPYDITLSLLVLVILSWYWCCIQIWYFRYSQYDTVHIAIKP